MPILPEPRGFQARPPHQIDFDGLVAGDYIKSGSHWFILESVNTATRLAKLPRYIGDDPIRDWDTVELKLVHAHWRGCDGY